MLLAGKGDFTMQRTRHESQLPANKAVAEAVLITLRHWAPLRVAPLG